MWFFPSGVRAEEWTVESFGLEWGDWSEQIGSGNVPQYIYSPSIAVDSENNYLVSAYLVITNDGNPDQIAFFKSTDRGSSWSVVTVTCILTSSVSDAYGYGIDTDIEVDPETGAYLIAYYDPVSYSVKLARSVDGGLSWSISSVFTGDSRVRTHGGIELAIDTDGRYVISFAQPYNFTPSGLFVYVSEDGGLSWDSHCVGSDVKIVIPTGLSLYCDGDGDYYVAYGDNSDGSYKVSVSGDSGLSWQTHTVFQMVNIGDIIGNIPCGVDIGGNADGSLVYVFNDWSSWPDVNVTHQASKSIDGGEMWSLSQNADNLIDDATYRDSLAMAAGLDSIASIHYVENIEGEDGFYVASHSSDNGNTWNTEYLGPGVWGQGTVDMTVDRFGNYIGVYPFSSPLDGVRELYLASYVNDLDSPEVLLTPLLSPLVGSTLTISGTVVDEENVISSVEYQIDTTSGYWSICGADDGNFDEMSEEFTCAVDAGSLSEGSHTIYVRATDMNGNVTPFGSYFSWDFIYAGEEMADDVVEDEIDTGEDGEVDEGLVETGEGVVSGFMCVIAVVVMWVGSKYGVFVSRFGIF